MAKPERKTSLAPTSQVSRLPGDPPTAEQEAAAKAATTDTIAHELKRSLDAEKTRQRELAIEYGKAGVKMAPLPEDVTPEQAYASHEETVAFIQAEMREQEQVNPPHRPTQGISEDSIELIKAEYAKSRKRIVLPSG